MAVDRRVWRALQVVFVAAILWYAVRLLGSQWDEVRALRESVDTDWLRVIWSSLIVLASYGVLVATWRATVQAWGQHISWRDALRIWFISNLGKYVPGKVWQIGAMGMMSQQAGVSPVAAVGSSLVTSLVHTLVGFGLVAATARRLLDESVPIGTYLPVTIAAMAIAVGAAPWLVPFGARAFARITGRPPVELTLPHRAIWVCAAGSIVAWALYGVAFRELAGALLGTTAGGVTPYIAVFTLSYLLGFLALPAPGGIGVREVSLKLLLLSAGLATDAEATWLVVASRLWLTVLEILPGALLMLLPSRPHSTPTTEST